MKDELQDNGTVLLTEDLTIGYGKKTIVSDINLKIQKGEIVTLIGPNGSGKSTLLKTLCAQLPAVKGKVFLLNSDLNTLNEKKIARSISLVMTDRIKSGLLTCRDIVATARYPYTNALGVLTDLDKKKIDEALELTDTARIQDCLFSKVSDGQKQRVMLARAICQDTEVIILDEPTSFLDLRYKISLMKIICFLAKEQNKTIVMSLHELDLAKEVSDKVIALSDGKVQKEGSPAKIFTGNFIQNLFGIEKEEFNVKNCHLKIQGGCARKKSKTIMIQGTMSNAGKSFITAALCRVFKESGFNVSPFKSQNMALNSYITKDGLEMGRAQVMQAEAAKIEPSVFMNPVLLKPATDTGSQVIVNGEVLGNMSAKEYFAFKKKLVPEIVKAYQKLEETSDIIVVEGAGSPAEINLRENDIVNMGLAEIIDAPVILVSDIDRGGVFAQILGTVELLSEEERARVKGFIINKFRGDKSLLEGGIKQIEERIRIPCLGVFPYIRISLDDEDSLSSRLEENNNLSLVNIGIIKLPHISNFTDFSVFENIDGVSLHYISSPAKMKNMDFLFIPGSKNTILDLRWLKDRGFDRAIKEFCREKAVFGICGGFQMLGKAVYDPLNIEEGGKEEGLNLLDGATTLKDTKTRTRISGRVEKLRDTFFDFLSEKDFSGYEIHMGETIDCNNEKKLALFNNNAGGTYVHGFFDEGNLARLLAEKLALKKGLALPGTAEKQNAYKAFKESQYDLLAQKARENLNMEAICKLLV